jgi:hypothetical protein
LADEKLAIHEHYEEYKTAVRKFKDTGGHSKAALEPTLMQFAISAAADARVSRSQDAIYSVFKRARSKSLAERITPAENRFCCIEPHQARAANLLNRKCVHNAPARRCKKCNGCDICEHRVTRNWCSICKGPLLIRLQMKNQLALIKSHIYIHTYIYIYIYIYICIAVLSAQVPNPMPDSLDQKSYPNLFAFMGSVRLACGEGDFVRASSQARITFDQGVPSQPPPQTAAQPHLTHRHQVLCCRNWKQF